MPSSMIHLLSAYKYKPNAQTLFYIGNIAPDCIDIREIKDKTHFRNKEDRINALSNFAKRVDINNDFFIGILFHLFLDLKWDILCAKTEMRAKFSADNWFKEYRNEIGVASSYIFHHANWSEKLWNDMLNIPQKKYDLDKDFPSQDIKNYIVRNSVWHRNNNLPESKIFSFDFIEVFSDSAVAEFRIWIKNFKKA